jgi:uncharacterized damage-inducible protein DinB
MEHPDMTIAQTFIAELKQEAATTRRMLERVPLDKADWKPHEKSMTLARLAGHVAEMPYWLSLSVVLDELDFAKFKYEPVIPKTTDELLTYFDSCVKKAEEDLAGCSDEAIMQNWTMRAGDRIYFTMPRAFVLRGMNFNHLIHHRAQLGVYLRLLDVPVPPVYGPTADEMPDAG